MKLRRIFVLPEEFTPEGINFSKQATKYLTQVLRLKAGDEIEVYDGRQKYLVRLKGASGGHIHGSIIESGLVEQPTRFEVVLAFSCVRPGPVEEILRHATELGVSRLAPLISSRTTRRPTERKERWVSIISAAAAQSGRSDLPDLADVTTLAEFIEEARGSATQLILSMDPKARPLLSLLEELTPTKIIILVGPEGGFDPSEQAEAVAGGFVPVGLGKSTLRTETAAISAVSMAMMWNEWFQHRQAINNESTNK
jgi:16S rRNA (uracil1498-N3)-methyltransferase